MDYPFPHADNAPRLQQHLDDLVKDHIHQGCLHLLGQQVEVCQQRVRDFPQLRQQMENSGSIEELTRIINTRKEMDDEYKDEGILNK